MNTADRRIAEVERYIHELAIALSGLPADEREDVIAGIREHIDGSLLAIADPTSADVQRVLDELGDPLAIAADAGAPAAAASRPPGTGTTPPSRAATPLSGAASAPRQDSANVPLLERDWVPMAVIGSFVLAGFFVWLGGPVLAFAAWLVGLVGLLASPLWHAVEKLFGVVVFVAGPAIVGGLVLGYVPGRGLFRDNAGPRVTDSWFGGYGAWPHLFELATAGIVVVLLAAVGAWLLARGSARARGSSRVRGSVGG
ncbi:MAG TPA: hypothetical protein VFZ85_08505 [Jiangellaceae bacterium]